MKIHFLCLNLTGALILLTSCNGKQSTLPVEPSNVVEKSVTPVTAAEYNNTKGYSENGRLITDFDCPDSKFFPPIDLKFWDKTPAVNNRLPIYAETKNGSSIHHYGERVNSTIKPYGMTLPKLAYRHNPFNKTKELVVVIQIVQSPEDTIVGFRYLTGGCGGSAIHNYQFLTDQEVKEVVGNIR